MPEKFNYVKKGYDPGEVDLYIEKIEEVLKSYKEKDAAIKNAFINAQIAADNIVKNAEIEAVQIKEKALKYLDEISHSIMQQKQFVKEFQEDYNHLVNKYIHQFNDREILGTYSKINELEEYIGKLQNEMMPVFTKEKHY